MKQFKKLIKKVSRATLSLAASTLLVSPISQAAGGGGSESGGLIQAIQQLGIEINSIATAGANALSDAVYQFDQNLPNIVQSNTANSTLSQQVAANTTLQTMATIQAGLQVFPQAVVPPSSTPPNQLQALTYGIPSSDTLYLPNSTLGNIFGGGNSSSSNNSVDFLTIDSVLDPTAYSSAQQQAAQNYLTFLTQTYIPLGTTLNLKPLAGLSSDAFNNFIRNNTIYQNYQASVRSYMTYASIAMSNFNQLMTERVVQTGLGTTAGVTVPGTNGSLQPIADASPLQVQEFIATQRVNNAQWYKDMAAASPATVQRETLFVLAEIEAQMMQLHLDNERVIATLSAMELVNALTMKQQLQAQESGVNTAVQSATGNAPSTPSNSPNVPPSSNLPQTNYTAQLPQSQ